MQESIRKAMPPSETIRRLEADRAAIERWEDEGGAASRELGRHLGSADAVRPRGSGAVTGSNQNR